MTLVELLVVIVILTTIVGAAIPLVSPSNDDRRLREAARTLNTYITGAQARAISTKRPYGIALKRLSRETGRAEDNGVSLELYYVEQPAPYAGFDANSRATVALHPNLPGAVLVRFVTRGNTTGDALPPGWDVDMFPPGMIRPHDVVEINGTRYELLTDTVRNLYTNVANVTVDTATKSFYQDTNLSDNKPVQIVAVPLNNSGQMINPKYDDDGREIGSQSVTYKPPDPYWTPPSPYKILRQPTPASDEPYQLPEGTAIDLRASGVGASEYFYVQGIHDNNQDVMIMFAPEGRVSRVAFNTTPGGVSNTGEFNQTVVDNVFLLLGRRENIAADAVANDPTLQSTITGVTDDEAKAKLRSKLNWLLGNARWIVIGAQSGRITTVENAMVDMAGVYNDYVATWGQRTEELRNEQIKAAREFTREGAQMTGR